MKLDATDIESLHPLIAAAVRSTLAEIAASDARLGNGQLAYDEATAASLLGTAKHSLRDLRLRGEIVGFLLGKKMHYSRSELLRFISER